MSDSPDIARAASAIDDFLRALGVRAESDPELAGTGTRVAEAFANELLAGYRESPGDILRERTATTAPGLVVVTNIDTVAMCPHHMLPSIGRTHLAYLPGEGVVGLGALARLVHCHARRFVLQEDLCRSVAESLVTHLGARGAGCIVDLVPTCMTVRGERQHRASASTSFYAGELGADSRAELLAAIARAR